MARRGTKYKKKSRRRGTTRRRKQTMVSTISTGISPYPKQFKCKLRFAISEQLTGAAVTGTAYLFRANDLYDPDVRAGGHQPRGFDEMMAAYDHFTVLGAKISVELNNNMSVPALYGVYVTDNTTYVNSNIELMERPGAFFRSTGDQSGGSKVVLKKTFSTSRFFGRPKSSIMADDQLRGNVSSSPTEKAYFGIYLNALDGVTTANADCTVVIDYICVFHEPSQISAS